MTTAGASIPVQRNASPNQVQGGPVIPVHVLTSGAVEAGAAYQLYEVSAAELAERGLSGGEPMRVSLAPNRQASGGPAIPVYVVSGSLGGGVTPPGPPASVYVRGIAPSWNSNASTDLDLIWNYLSGIAGSTDTDMYADEGSFAPALSRAALLIQMPETMGLLGADQWVAWRAFGDQLGATASDWMGFSLRTSLTADNYYGFWYQSAAYEIFKFLGGSKTVLKSGALSPVAATYDTWRFEVEGTALRVYRNDVLLDSATDSSITTANEGCAIQTSGFEINLRAGMIRCGDDFPYDTTNHVVALQEWRTNIYGDTIAPGGTQVIANCADFLLIANIDDQAAITGAGANQDNQEPHFFTWDMGEKYKFSRIRTWGDAGVNNNHDWTDVDIEVSDDNVTWTTVATGMTFDNVNANGWKYSPRFDTDAEGRYMRVTINATLHPTNRAETEEVEIWSGFDDDLWWLCDTVTHGDCWAAWRMKGVFSYWNSRANANSAENGTGRVINQAVGVIPWTQLAGMAFDGTNYGDARFVADGTDHTIIARFSNADGTGTKPVLGDAVGPGGIAFVGATATSILVSNQSTGDVINVASVAQDMTIAVAGNQYYLDGVGQGTLTGYSAAAGTVSVKLGGVHGVAGSSTMVAAAIYDRKLTATEVAAITTRMQAL